MGEMETKEICERILSGTQVRDPSLKEKETINHLLSYLQALQDLSDEGVSTADVCQLHKTLLKDIHESAGHLRTQPACAGMDTQYPDPEFVPTLLEKVLSSFNDLDKNLCVTPYAKAAWLKCRFVEVHPFDDGNGRLSRILMNWVLFKYGFYFSVAIACDGHKQTKKHHMQSLKKAISGRCPGNLSFLLLRSEYNSIRDFEHLTKGETLIG